jgi:peptide/nickel transport system permease protein
MLKYCVKRIIMMVPVILGVVFVVFTILHFSPNDPIRTVLGVQATQEEVDIMREEMGLNNPFGVQFYNYLKNIVTKGDFGVSYVNRKPVVGELFARLPITMSLAVMSIILAGLIGIPFGIISAVRQYSVFDYAVTVTSLIFLAMPAFWMGLMMIIVFSLKLKMLPASGWYGPLYWVLPVVTIGTGCVAGIMRITRSSMLETIRQDYIRTARSKGQKESVIIFKHALRNAIIPVITLMGLQFGRQLGGAFVVETVFAIPGLGKYLVDASGVKDIPVVQGGVILVALMFSFVNLAVDLLYGFIDPRIFSIYKSKRRKGVADA